MRNLTLLSLHSRSICRNHFLRLSGLTGGIPQEKTEDASFDKTLEEEAEEEPKNFSGITPRMPKTKHVLQVVYCGSGYYGMQLHYGSPLPTVEGHIVSALVKAQCIPEICSTNLKPLRFQRCARTDKGVSALAQVISLRLSTKPAEPMEAVNSYLPPEIRVIGMKRATRSFNAKLMCDARTYSYTLPTFALSRTASSVPDSSFRLSREDFHRINTLLSFYKGTHRFHNFTTRKSSDDRSVCRYILQISCSEPFVCREVEFARIVITGQSFMKHQIRKMVGLIIAVAKGHAAPEMLPLSVQPEKISLPLAPSLGLVLECTHFDFHNQCCHRRQSIHTVTWEELLPTTEAFREEKIMPVIIEGELQDLSISSWLQQLDTYT